MKNPMDSDRCFDEVFPERRNFETQVEINRTNEARDGTGVQSQAKPRMFGFSVAADKRTEGRRP